MDTVYLTPLWYKVSGVISVAFLVGSFFVEPLGVIDTSVLEAVGLIGLFSFAGMLPSIIKTAKSVKVSKGNTTIEVSNVDTPFIPDNFPEIDP